MFQQTNWNRTYVLPRNIDRLLDDQAPGGVGD
jgi:hypothetical protein